jgi:hypothetical protein
LTKTGAEDLSWPMPVIYDTIGLGTSQNVAIRVKADLTEFFLGETRFGVGKRLRNNFVKVPVSVCLKLTQLSLTSLAYAESRIITETIRLAFLGTAPKVFKPGMPFSAIARLIQKCLVTGASQIPKENQYSVQTPSLFQPFPSAFPQISSSSHLF